LAGAAAIVLVSSGGSQAHTITVENLSQSPSTGVYQYSIIFDSEAYVAPGDGFVMYDFPGLTSWTLTGTGAAGSLNSSGTGTTSTGPIKLTETDPSNALSDGDAQSLADLDASAVALDNGFTIDPTVNNLSFSWVGAPSIYMGAATATLTLDTTVVSGDATSVYASVDRSGADPGTSYGTAEGTIFEPVHTSVPEPAAGLLSLVMIGGASLRRRRRQV
jgi:hypothetical protein